MHNRLRLPAAVLISAALVWFLFLFLSPREPAYQGKPLSRWLADLGPSLGPSSGSLMYPRILLSETGGYIFNVSGPSHQRTQEALRAMGTNTLPRLVQILHQPDPSRTDQLKIKLDRLIEKQPLVKWRLPVTQERHARALYALLALGPVATPAWTEILGDRRLNDRVRQQAARQLSGMGAQSLPALEQALLDPNEKIRDVALRSIETVFRTLNCRQPPNARILEQAVSHPNLKVQEFAAHALLGCNPENVTAHLLILRVGSSADRNGALWNLGRLRKNPEMVVPALIAALDSADAGLRESAAEALGKFGDQAQSAVPALIERLADPKRYVRVAVTNALKAIGPGAAAKPSAD